MKLKKGLTILLTSIGLVSTPTEILEEKIEREVLKRETIISALDFERMQGLSSWYDTSENSNLLNKFINEKGLLDGLEEGVFDEKEELIRLVKEYSSPEKKFNKDHYKEEIFPKFIELNKLITKKKEDHDSFSIWEFENRTFLLKKAKADQISISEQEIIDKYRKKVHALKELEVNEKYSVVARTMLNTTKTMHLIKYLNNKNIDENSILSIIAKESIGTSYIVGPKNEINNFQINPVIIPNLYIRLKNSNKEEDNLYKEILQPDKKSLVEFSDDLKKYQENTTAFGLYYMKEINKESKNESHFVLLYHLGASRFKELPSSIRKRVLSDLINDAEDITEKDVSYKGMNYLKNYYTLKEKFERVNEYLKMITEKNDS
ncbi:MAG: lytic transglycosylase domain-containing protein [Nanoarchaeota archaeon]|nr:lytic transglycosylase domain-containing protein [Nanoarchaeota archaeon]MBU1269175.1 lytic transglycosylase domain-containing protein [Nanoarchaeota archaeon]MBU1604916.1 lytic transglycosylase domain-containing protein [Nanoarchaeota archaeon]MBU2443590.1 lytic transglycosylase domain-containing protein [Nanoarchaeota archaeon]